MYRQAPDSYTLEEYWRLVETFPDRKYEYIAGLIRMMAGGSPAHGQIEMNIGRVLGNALFESECNVYSSDVTVELAEYCYRPDLSVSCDPHDWARKKALIAPTVVVEVLSPTTENTDRTEKLDAYRQYPTIQDILLADSRRHYIEHHHRAGPENKWEVSIYKKDDDSINLASIEVTLFVRDIYHKVWLELEEP